MPDKTAASHQFLLRLPKPLHKRLVAQAKRNNVSLNTEIVNQLETHGATTVERVAEWLKPALDDAIKEALGMAVYRTTRESRDRAEGFLDMLLSGRGMPDIPDQRPLRTEAELAERMRRGGFPEDSVVYYLQIFRDRQAAKKAKEK
jgi:hypothetical protein